jgi:hypothetical protein
MNFIFKSILDNGRLFKIHHQVIKETMLAAIESNDEEALESVAILQTLGVESIVKQEILMVQQPWWSFSSPFKINTIANVNALHKELTKENLCQ